MFWGTQPPQTPRDGIPVECETSWNPPSRASSVGELYRLEQFQLRILQPPTAVHSAALPVANVQILERQRRILIAGNVEVPKVGIHGYQPRAALLA